MGFGPIDRPKELVLSELATTFARLLTRGGNRVGAILFDNEIEQHAPAAQRPEPGARPRPATCCGPPGPNGTVTDLTGLLESALGAIRRRSLIVLISDFITAPGWERPLLQLTERHEVVAIRLLDPREYELPDAGVIVVEDAETGEQLVVDSSDAEFRHRLREAGEHREAELRAADPPRRRRHLRGLDRGRSRCRARAHRRVAQAAAPLMSFGSPWMLLCLAVVPLLGARVLAGASGGAPSGPPGSRPKGSCRPPRRAASAGGATSPSRSSRPRSRSSASRSPARP